MRVWTDTERMETIPDGDGGYVLTEIARLLKFKGKNIHAKADPELFFYAAAIIDKFNDILEEAGEYHENGYEKKTSAVNHPSHYNAGSIETIDYIEALGLGHDFCIGNAIKYLSRADHKGNKIEDLEKAIWYIQRAIEEEKNEKQK